MRVVRPQRTRYPWRWTAALGVLAILVASAVVWLTVTPTERAGALPNFVVDSLLDLPDFAANGVCATAGGVCTLRAALDEATNIC